MSTVTQALIVSLLLLQAAVAIYGVRITETIAKNQQAVSDRTAREMARVADKLAAADAGRQTDDPGGDAVNTRQT